MYCPLHPSCMDLGPCLPPNTRMIKPGPNPILTPQIPCQLLCHHLCPTINDPTFIWMFLDNEICQDIVCIPRLGEGCMREGKRAIEKVGAGEGEGEVGGVEGGGRDGE